MSTCRGIRSPGAAGRRDEAPAAYRRAVAIKPDFFEAHQKLGTLLQAMGKYEEAAGILRCTIELRPGIAEVHLTLGTALAKLGRHEGAGAAYRGRPVGAGAALAAFSFHPRKLLTTGEGGMLTTGDPAIAARARRLREHGMDISAADRHRSRQPVIEHYTEVGFNFRMTDIQAAVGLVQVRQPPAMVARRRARARRPAPRPPQGCPRAHGDLPRRRRRDRRERRVALVRGEGLILSLPELFAAGEKPHDAGGGAEGGLQRFQGSGRGGSGGGRGGGGCPRPRAPGGPGGG